jgi:hypothetical protein
MHPASASRGSRGSNQSIRRVAVAGSFSTEWRTRLSCLTLVLRIRRQMEVGKLRVVSLDHRLLSGRELNGYRLLRSRI